MSKSILAALVAFSSVSAFATPHADIACITRAGAPVQLSLQAQNLYILGPNDAEMSKITVKYRENGKTEVGRLAFLKADVKYRPTKYKNSVRFDLSKLVDTKNFGVFAPGDSCFMNAIIPLNAMTRGPFVIPVIVNCDQGGGTLSLDCSISNRAND